MSSSPAPLERALLTRDWEGMADRATVRTKSGRLAKALIDIRAGNEERVAADRFLNPGESMRYLMDMALWRLGRLGEQRGESFADAFARLHAEDLVTVATIQKSGTHWMRFFLTNYARVLAKPGVQQPISYPQLLKKFYGNNRWQVFREAEPYRPPTDLLAEYGVSDVTMQHFRADFDPFVFTPGKKIMLYRNPLDYVISMFHYTIKQRPKNRDRAAHPRDVITPMLTEYAHDYITLSSYRDDPDVFVASYEELRRDPAGRFREVVSFLGLPLVDEAADRALALSDISTIRAMEEKQGRSMVVKLDGYFTRDGSIGQWKEYLDDDDVARAAGVLGGYGISLDEFVTDDAG